MVTIELVDGGATRYEQKSSGKFLGRMYDDRAESVVVVRPEREAGRTCTMWVKAKGELVDAINVGENGVVEVRNNISQFDKVCVGFTFTDESGYLKNSEPVEYYFAEGIKPEDFEPVEPEQKGKLQLLLDMAFADAEWDEENPNAINFYNIDGELRKQFEVSGGSRTQSDWAENDPSKPEYIKNKPTIPTSTSELTNDGGDGEHPFADSTDIANVNARIDGVEGDIDTIDGNITTLADGLNQAEQGIQSIENRVDTAETDIENLEGSVNQVADDLATETTNRTNAVNGLQNQIDAMTSRTDVVDVVGTYAQLQAYVTTALGDNDIVKVLVDETRQDAISYYRWHTATSSWSYVGSQGPFYTKAEANTTFAPQTTKINGKPLSGDINLDAENVGALPDDTFIPTKTGDLDNNSGFITASDLPTTSVVVEIGSQQFIYEDVVLPKISVDDLKAIYPRAKAGIYQVLHWTLYGSENNLVVVSSDYVAGNYTIDVLIHNQYHAEYKWTDATTGYVEPNVRAGGEGTPTDVKVNGISITQNNVANLVTETEYDASTNKIATMADIQSVVGDINNRLEDVLGV